ncbi:MAG: transketolase [Balneolaceae bacterium]|nr:transketolase [Balneolaceae bacterium]
MTSSVDDLCVNTIRALSMDAVQQANSGHPGMPMGMADAAYVLWTKHLIHHPHQPQWFNRDRFVLSAGHGSMLLYSLLHLTGYDVSIEDLKAFRQWDSITPGHPEVGLTAGVETTTGPLGQGFATGVGMAMAEAHLAARFNRDGHHVIDHHTYAIVSDGDLMEGVSHEAASMAGHMKLGKLVYLYDANQISIDGSTDLSFTENVAKRFEAYGWHVIECDGHDRIAVDQAIDQAKSTQDQPSLIVCRTHIGFGSPNKQDSESSHGAPLGEEEVAATKKALGLDPAKTFDVPVEVADAMGKAVEDGTEAHESWLDGLDAYREAFPDLAQELERRMAGDAPTDESLDGAVKPFATDAKGMASRKSSGVVLQQLKDVVPELVGGSADLTGSNNTSMDDAGIFSPSDYSGRNIHYGVREHAMGAAMNGMALHGGVRPFGGTFLIFSDYCRPAIRLAALSHIPAIYVFTHDSIGLGEDGPTHQPIEHLASLRAMPNVWVLRPGDANEVAEAWKMALKRQDGPTLLILTRQNIPTLDREELAQANHAAKGAYILKPGSQERPSQGVDVPDVTVCATGSELSIAVDVATKLEEANVSTRVVSMPSWEVFDAQSKTYQHSVIPRAEGHVVVSIEAGSTFGWKNWVGEDGLSFGLDHFGASAPADVLYDKFGLTPEAISEAILSHRSTQQAKSV